MKRLSLLLLAVSSAASADPAVDECTTTTTTRCTGAAAQFAVPLPLELPLTDGWQLERGADGSLWRRREISTASPGMWGTGLALLSAGWLAAGVSSLTSGPVPGLGFIPVMGAWGTAATSRVNCSDRCAGDSSTALWVLDGAAQAAGLAMLLAGLSAGPKKIERLPLLVLPGAVGMGAGLTTTGRF